MIKLKRIRHIFKPSGKNEWSITHAQTPFAMQLEGGEVRIFYATRDNKSRSSVGFVDVDPDTFEVLNVSDAPAIVAGDRGTFDDSGVMPSWFIRDEKGLLLYYTGWNRSDEASYQLAIGMAISDDEGKHFTRLFSGPVLDRGPFDPVWVGQPCVIRENDTWRMWYLSCQKIEMINNHPEPFYNIKYAESHDGTNWERKEIVCIDFSENVQSIGRPCVIKHPDGGYIMFHSNRKATEYRTDPQSAYRIVCSTSHDGIHWKESEFEWLGEKGDWESDMNEYTCYLNLSNKHYLFYNGNGFGQSGFGLAEIIFE